jgi:ribokinase
MKLFDVIGFGALNVDKLYKVNKIAGPEEEGFIKGFEEACGGSAANTVVGLARLGCKVGFIGKVAKDPEGKMLMEGFRREGVNTKGIIRADAGRSGTVMGFVDERGERALYVDPGVNDTISFEEIDMGYACQAKFIHLTSFVGKMSFEARKGLWKTSQKTLKLAWTPESFTQEKA